MKDEPIDVKLEVLEELEHGFRVVILIQEGKMKGIPLNEFLEEL